MTFLMLTSKKGSRKLHLLLDEVYLTMCSDDDQNEDEGEDDRMRRRNDEWVENENSSCSRCQVPTRTLIDPAGPLLLSLDDDGDDIEADDDDNAFLLLG